jgi:hypothetical protein
LQIARKQTFFNDFGTMSAGERAASIDRDHFELGRPVAAHARIIYLDDIRITGAHERKIISSLRQQHVANDMFIVHYAELQDATVNPTIESDLNFCAFAGFEDVARLPRTSAHFALNARFTKHVLGQSRERFVWFAALQNRGFLRQLYSAIQANGYDKVAGFIENVRVLEESIGLLPTVAVAIQI